MTLSRATAARQAAIWLLAIVLLALSAVFGWHFRSKPSIVCASNLHKLGEAASICSEDNDGYLPPFTTERPKVEASHMGARYLAAALRVPVKYWKCPTPARGEAASSYGTPIDGVYDYETGLECLNKKNRNSFGLHLAPSTFERAATAVYLQDIIIRVWHQAIFIYPHPTYGNALFMDGHVGKIKYGH